MGSNISSLQSVTKVGLATGPRLAGISQKVAVVLWSLVTLTSVLSLSISIYRLNLWDRIPANQTAHYFPDMTPEYGKIHAEWQNTILETGLSLSGYATLFTLARIVGGLSLLIVGFMLIRHYSDHLMAVLMAGVLSVFAAAGIWNNTLFPWAVTFTPWLGFPIQVLGWLLWCAAIVIYTFPDGKFTPRWTVWLAIFLLPITFLLAFDIDIPLNPGNWPGPLYLLPNIVFVGAGLFAVIHRYRRTLEPEQRQAMRSYVWGLSILVIVYFINLLLTDIYYLAAGHSLFQTNSAILTYILLNEPIWFACETYFAVGLAVSVFQNKLLEST